MATWTDGVDLSVHRGLEIGALHNPRFDPASDNIYFVDHADTQSLRAKYASDAGLTDHLDALVDVDFVWGASEDRLAEVVKEVAPLDFVYASHVFEHLANPVGWLDELYDVLVDGGIVSLVIPDKRFCFDINRRETEIADVVDGYLSRATRPSYRQIYDFYSKMVAVDTIAAWAGADYSKDVRSDIEPDLYPMDLCHRSAEGEYIDSHCGVYTPDSFLTIVEKLAKLGLLRFRVRDFQATPVNSLEFRVVLEKLPDLSAELRRPIIEASVREAREAGGVSPTASQPGEVGAQPVLGPRELALITRKRQAVDSMHRLRARLAGWRR